MEDPPRRSRRRTVTDAGDSPPTVPFWLGEAPARTAELSAEVSQLRARIDEFLALGDADGALAWLREVAGVTAKPRR